MLPGTLGAGDAVFDVVASFAVSTGRSCHNVLGLRHRKHLQIWYPNDQVDTVKLVSYRRCLTQNAYFTEMSPCTRGTRRRLPGDFLPCRLPRLPQRRQVALASDHAISSRIGAVSTHCMALKRAAVRTIARPAKCQHATARGRSLVGPPPSGRNCAGQLRARKFFRKLRLPVLGGVEDVQDVDCIRVNPIHGYMAVPALCRLIRISCNSRRDSTTLPRGWSSPTASICRWRKSTYRAAWAGP